LAKKYGFAVILRLERTTRGSYLKFFKLPLIDRRYTFTQTYLASFGNDVIDEADKWFL
jgi:hypothetical protein